MSFNVTPRVLLLNVTPRVFFLSFLNVMPRVVLSFSLEIGKSCRDCLQMIASAFQLQDATRPACTLYSRATTFAEELNVILIIDTRPPSIYYSRMTTHVARPACTLSSRTTTCSPTNELTQPYHRFRAKREHLETST